jgi:hypothetical protein
MVLLSAATNMWPEIGIQTVGSDNNKVKEVVTKLMSLSSGLLPIRFMCIERVADMIQCLSR